MFTQHVVTDPLADADQTVTRRGECVGALLVSPVVARCAARHVLAYCDQGLHALLGYLQSSTGCAIDVGGILSETAGEFATEGDPLCHGVRKGSLTKDTEAEEVDVDLSDPSYVPPSHVFTSRGIMGLDFLRVKVFNGAVQASKDVSGMIRAVAPAQRHRERRAFGPPALFVFWRWLTCGHGHHHWQIQVGLDLATTDPDVHIHAVRSCPRCRTVEVIE